MILIPQTVVKLLALGVAACLFGPSAPDGATPDQKSPMTGTTRSPKSGSAVPGEAALRQKCPMTVPDSIVVPASLNVQRWDPAGSILHGIPIVTVSLNDSRQERAAIATGLNANVVSPSAAARLKLTPLAGQVKIDALNATASAGQMEIGKFRAGSTLELSKLAVAVADVPGMLSTHPRPDAPQTWLGTPFLSAFQVTLDPESNSITLQKATAKLPRTRLTTVEKIQLRDGRPYVKVTVPGSKPFWALFDTSSPGTLIPTEVVQKLKLKPDSKDNAVAELPKLSVGKAEWKLARVTYVPPGSSKELDHTFAVLGMNFIEQYKVTIDFLHLQIALTPREPATPPGTVPQPAPVTPAKPGRPNKR